MAPYRGWKGWITGAQAGYQVSFVGTDGPFSCVFSVNMRRDKLEVKIFVLLSSFEFTKLFISEYLYIGGFLMTFENVKDLLPCGDDACSLTILDGY